MNDRLRIEGGLRSKPQAQGFDTTLLWPTQIAVARYAGVEELNAGLLALIGSPEFSTYHYRSEGDLWRYESAHPVLAELRAMFTACAERWLAEARLPARRVQMQQAWAYRYVAGEYLDIHDHGGTHLSGVYYVEVPPEVANPAKQSERTPKQGGHLVFHDCRRGVLDTVREWQQKPCHSVRPEVGMLVTFPGHLLHQVKPFMGPGVRTIVSNNIWFSWN